MESLVRRIRLGALTLASFAVVVLSSFVDPGALISQNFPFAERAVAAKPPVAQTSYVKNLGRQARNPAIENAPVHTFYINGINTPRADYEKTKPMLINLLRGAGVARQALQMDTHNSLQVDYNQLLAQSENSPQSNEHLLQGFGQAFLGAAQANDGKVLVNQIVDAIQRTDEAWRQEAQKRCEDLPRAKYLLIGHSQGTFLIKDVAQELIRRHLPGELEKRVVLMAFSPFVSFDGLKQQGPRVEYLLRADDFPAQLSRRYPEVVALASLVGAGVPGDANLPPLTTAPGQTTTAELARSLGLQAELLRHFNAFLRRHPELTWVPRAFVAHDINNYLGNPSARKHSAAARVAFGSAVNKLRDLLAFDSGQYEKRESCWAW